MRIIAGTARHRIIKPVPDQLTRPTTDRIKESIFNILQFQIADKRILDIFSGTGNMALESLSRGARNAVYIDQRKISIETIQENIRSLGFEKQSRVIFSTALKAIETLGNEKATFDIIFCDPPYNKGFEIPTMELLAATNLLDTEGILIVRHQQNTVLPETVATFHLARQKKYGDCRVSFYSLKSPDSDSNTEETLCP